MSDECTGTEVAIIGMACRYPKTSNLDDFWRHLRDGDELISFFSDEELLARGAAAEQLRDPRFVKAAGELEDTELFDAAFFGFMPREAELMDPQQRLMLECAWEAFENAGYAPGRYDGPIGVYVGAVENTYLLFNLMTNPQVRSMELLPILFVNGRDYLPTRISYKLNLRGPSCLVQSACSTSLVAIHNACQSLINGECDIALAGGVSVLVHQRMGYSYLEGGIVSPDGHCRSFDAQAQGTIFGSGLGAVVLKPLDKALEDGDTIRAVICGSAVNNDGSLKVSYTAPGVGGQTEVILEALSNAAVSAASIGYVEAHGTATTMGDTIEVQALTQAFRKTTDQSGFCALGSVKSNLGHLDAAAGVTGVIKTVLALEHGQLPPSLHCTMPNPKIDFATSPFYVNTRLSEWRAGATPRRAGVSSFGIGGTNAHLILEEAPRREPAEPGQAWQLLLLSARSAPALEVMAANLAGHLRGHPEQSLADVAYTLQVGRMPFAHRRALVCRDRDEAIVAFEQTPAVPSDRQAVIREQQEDRAVAFMFPGQGTQYAGMAHELYQGEPVFREWIDTCAGLLRAHLGLDIREVLYPTDARMEEREPSILDPRSSILDQTQYAQPALFAVEYALAQLWMSWGVRPKAVIGHSVGEYVAACLAGVLALEDALGLVAVRGRLMQETQPGAMLAVTLPEQELRRRLRTLDVAAVNAPDRCVVSGSVPAIAELERELAAEGVTCRRLRTSHAFHSALMDPLMPAFADHVRRVRLKPPQMPYLSNLSGAWITARDATDPDYWVRHLRKTVRFADGLATLRAQFSGALLEVGPGQTLSTFARQQSGDAVFVSLRHPHEHEPDAAFLLNTVAQLWLAGVAIDWSAFAAGERRGRVPLPAYPFERRRYWIEPGEMPPAQPAAVAVAEVEQQPALASVTEAWRQGNASTALPPEHANGNGTHTTRRRRKSRDLEQIVTQQLDILTQQLHILRAGRSKKGREG